jgi:hypothetical protein
MAMIVVVAVLTLRNATISVNLCQFSRYIEGELGIVHDEVSSDLEAIHHAKLRRYSVLIL